MAVTDRASRVIDREDLSKLDVVELDSLEVDHRYQRTLKQRLVEQTMLDWDDKAVDPLTLSRREDGSLWIVDGQHRSAAARLLGESEMLAFVYDGLTLEEEASLRLKKHNRRADTAQERFYSRLEARDPSSMAILEIVNSVHSKVNRVNNNATGINCVGTLDEIYARDGSLLLKTLQTIREAFGGVHGEHAKVDVITGVSYFLSRHAGEYSHRQLVHRMQLAGVEDLRRRASTHKAISGGSAGLNFYRALVQMYNGKHRKADNKLEVKNR